MKVQKLVMKCFHQRVDRPSWLTSLPSCLRLHSQSESHNLRHLDLHLLEKEYLGELIGHLNNPLLRIAEAYYFAPTSLHPALSQMAQDAFASHQHSF